MLAVIPEKSPDGGTTYDTTGSDLLVAQKDRLYEWLNEKQYDKVLDALELLQDLWRANRYHYKLHDLAYRIGEEVHAAKSALHHRAIRQQNEMLALIVRADAIRDANPR